MSKPAFVYKLVPYSSPPPDPLPEALSVSTLDSTSGFIHLSTAVQVPNTLKRFFAEDPRIYILRIPYDTIEKDVRWEDPKGEVPGGRGEEGVFPHLYNGLRLGSAEIESIQLWERGQSGWDETLERAKGWLVY